MTQELSPRRRRRTFSESQAFSGKAYAVLAVAGLLPLGLLWASPFLLTTTAAGRDAGMMVAVRSTITLTPVLLLLANLLYMRTKVEAQHLTVTFGALFPLVRRQYRLEDVLSAEAVEYQPLREFGGWGIRRGYGESMALTARGDEGVRISLRGGGRLLVGSQRADDLAAILLQSPSE